MSDLMHRYAPAAARAFDAVHAARTALDLDLDDPAVELFADQFGVDVSLIDDDMRRRFLAATGPTAFEVAQAVYVDDFWPRAGIAIGAVLGSSTFEVPAPTGPRELWPLVEDFMREVARLDTLDPVVTELVRLRVARQHECRVCRSRRSVAAIDAGADAATFAAVDHHADSSLPDATKAALALTDAIIWSPYLILPEVAAAAAEHLRPEQVVELVLDVTRNAAHKIAVALGADAAAVTDGVELFVTDADGNLTVVGADPR